MPHHNWLNDGQNVLLVLMFAASLTFAITTTFNIGHASAIKITKPVVGATKTAGGGGTGPTVVAKDCLYNGLTYSKGMVIQQSDGMNYRCTGDDDGTWEKI